MLKHKKVSNLGNWDEGEIISDIVAVNIEDPELRNDSKSMLLIKFAQDMKLF